MTGLAKAAGATDSHDTAGTIHAGESAVDDARQAGIVRFRLLGRLQVVNPAGTPHELPSAKRRALLTALLLQPGVFVPTERLQEFLWDSPPASAAANVRSYVTGVRADLGTAGLGMQRQLRTLSGGGGYHLLVDADAVDLHAFLGAASKGRAALRRGDPATAATTLEEGLKLWRAPFGTGLPETRRILAHAAGLDHTRLDACQDLYAAYVLTGVTAMLAFRIERSIADAPYRERLWQLLAAAHYRNGDVGSALSTVARCRTRFGDDLGLDLPPIVQQMQSAILRRDDGRIREFVGGPGSNRQTVRLE